MARVLSDAGRASHWARGHALLCVGGVADCDAAAHPLVRYKVLAIESNEILLLAASAFCEVLSRDLPCEEALAAWAACYGHFESVPWDRVVVHAAETRRAASTPGGGGDPAGGDDARGDDAEEEEEEDPLRATLRALCCDAAALLRAAVTESVGAERAALVSAERLSLLVGAFEMNNVGVRRVPPARDSHAAPPAEGAGAQSADSWPLEGTSLYTLTCMANHSCDPSLEVLYDAPKSFAPDDLLHVTLVAKRAIAQGEELHIAYVDTHKSTKSRRRLLADYGFLCKCARCCETPDDADQDDSDDDSHDSHDDDDDEWEDADSQADDDAPEGAA